MKIYQNGSADSPVLVLIHGGAGGVWTLEETAQRLTDFCCLLPELPGHGTSTKNLPFSIQAAARQILLALENRTNDKPVHLFGLSVGGQVALEMLALAPQRFASAVISSAVVLPIPGYRLGIYSPAAMRLVYWLAIAPWKRCEPWIRWSMQVSSGIDLRYLKQYRENFQGLTPASWTQAMSAFYAYRLPAGLEKAVLPVLLVAGAHESGDVWPTNRLLNRVLPNSCSVVVGDGGRMPAVQEHNWPVNSPGLCAEVIRAWAIKQQLAPGLAEVDTG